MQGTIININQPKNICDIHVAEGANTYSANIEQFKNDTNFKIGADCEFEIISEPSMFKKGQATLKSCKALNLHNEKVALTSEGSVKDHEVLHINNEYLIAAEGRFERECRSALIEKAIECNANALLNLNLECIQRPGVKAVLFRYTAKAAQITGPKYQIQDGIKLNIPTKVARRNSPNEAQVRYVRVLLLSLLFILVPCVLSLTQQGVIPSKIIGQTIIVALITLSMIVFLFISYTKRQSYILNTRPIRKG